MANKEEQSERGAPEAGDEAAAARDDQPAGAHAHSAQATETTLEAGGSESEEVEALRHQLAEAETRAEANWDKTLRVQAELENVRKRAQRDLEHAHKYGLERFASEVLAVKDSLELGLNAAGSEADAAKLTEGMELTLKMFGQALGKFNIEAIDPRGEAFDPERHQAMTVQETAELAPNSVVTVMQKGYWLNDRLLRPALVIVSKAPAEERREADQGDGAE